jgi:hypothetical protein
VYKILGSDQKEYGPVSADVLRQWIAQGRVNAQTQTQAEGTTVWKPLAEFTEFAEALASGTPAPTAPRQPVSIPTGPAPDAQQKGLAIASLILGLLSLCGSFLTGIPAIICGAIAISQARRNPARYGGTGMAVAGLVLGGVFTLMAPALMLPALAKAKGKAQTINCVNNLKQIGLAARMYSSDHKAIFPPSFMAMSNELVSPKVLHCPSDSRKPRIETWEQCTPANVTYEFLMPGVTEADAMGQVVFRCPIHNNVCFGDGSVQQQGGGGMPRPMRPPPRR